MLYWKLCCEKKGVSRNYEIVHKLVKLKNSGILDSSLSFHWRYVCFLKVTVLVNTVDAAGNKESGSIRKVGNV